MNDVELIKLVERHPMLYNKRSSGFKIKSKQNNAWEEVAEKLGQDVEFVRARWLCLRQRFSRERNKVIAGAETSEVWEHFNQLKFLEPIVKVRKKFSHLKNGSLKETALRDVKPLEFVGVTNEEENSWASSEEQNPSRDTSSVEPGSRASSTEPIAALVSKKLKTLQPSETESECKRRRIANVTTEDVPNSQMIEHLQHALQGMNALIAKTVEPAAPADPDDIFGQFVASQLKTMETPEKKHKIKKICAILLE